MMRKFYTLKSLLASALLVACTALSAQQTTVTYAFTDYTEDDSPIASGRIVEQTTGLADVNLSYTGSPGKTPNMPKYYSDGARFYAHLRTGQGSAFTITPENGAVITSVTIEGVPNYTPPVKYNVNSGDDAEASLSGTVYTIANINATQRLTFRNALEGKITQLRVQRIIITYTGGVQPKEVVAIPTITPATGNYYTPQTVSIGTETTGATIHYTTDGSEPTVLSPVYSASFVVDSTTTVKAIAVAEGKDNSAVATSVLTFPGIDGEVTTLSRLKELVNDNKTYKYTGEAVITLKSAYRNAKYIQDATGAVLLDDVKGALPSDGCNVGDKLTNLVGYVTSFQGMPQFVPHTAANTVSAGNVVEPVVVEPSLLENYQAQLVKVKGLTFAGAGRFAATTNYSATANGVAVVVRTQYSDLSVIGSEIPTTAVDVTGVVLTYVKDGVTTHQLVPILIEDATAGIGGATDATTGISVADGKILATADGKAVVVCNMLGQVVSKATVNGTVRIAVPAGKAYIVKVGQKVVKVFVK